MSKMLSNSFGFKSRFNAVMLLMQCLLYFVYGEVQADTSPLEDGGWTTPESAQLAQPGPCNIEIEDASMTQKEFLQRYAYSEPVVIRGVSDNSVFKKLCSKDMMMKEYGEKIIRISTANTHSYKKVDMTLEKYVNEILKPQSVETLLRGNETLYWFGDNNHTEWSELFDKYVPPPYHLPDMGPVYSFGVAGAGTGVPFHFHGPGFAETIYGRKRWFVYPPNKQPVFHPNYTTLHWFLEDYPNLPRDQLPLECTLSPGEVLYFPDSWWHATLNIDSSSFITAFLTPVS